MSSFIGVAWLIPFTPLACSIVIGLLLLAFNKTMNRLTKPVSILLIMSVGISTFLSFILYKNHAEGLILDWDASFIAKNLHLNLYINSFMAESSSIAGLFFLILMLYSFYSLERKQGYVRYFVLLGALCGLFISFVLSGDLFYNLFDIGTFSLANIFVG